MLTISKNNILVRINKTAQLLKKNATPSGIIIPDAFQYMQRYLQFGEILQVGSVALKKFPEMEPGDTALFHHTIEDGDTHLLDIEKNKDELRYLDGRNLNQNYEIFGVIKKDGGYIIPAPMFIFLDNMVRPAKRQIESDLAVVDQEMWTEEERIQEEIKTLVSHTASLKKTFDHLENVRREMTDAELNELQPTADLIDHNEKRQKELTRSLNKANAYSGIILHIHEVTANKLGIYAGDRIIFDKRDLYPLDVLENRYLLLKQTFIWGVGS